MSQKPERKSKGSRYHRLQMKHIDVVLELGDIRRERDDLKRGNAELVTSLSASSEHLRRVTDLCNSRLAEIVELKTVCKILSKYI